MLLDIDTQGALSVMSRCAYRVGVHPYQVLRQPVLAQHHARTRLSAGWMQRAPWRMMRRYRYVIINENLDEAYRTTLERLKSCAPSATTTMDE